MTDWLAELRYNPLEALTTSGNAAVTYFARRDLLGEDPGPVEAVWGLPEVRKVLRKQRDDGSWGPSGKADGYPLGRRSLVETFKALRGLVRRYQLTRDHEAVARASEYMFGWQTLDGDFRGFIGDQYATYYTGETMAVLILCGYADDPRIRRGFQWLLSMRQGDGGWTIPILTHRLDRATGYRATAGPWETIEPDRSKPFSHNWTDMVLRAFAVHPEYRCREEALHAAKLLKSRFFKPDAYASYRDPGYWVRFEFWWPNLVTGLDSLSRMGFSRDDSDIRRAVDWLVEHQRPDGLWSTSYKAGDVRRDTPLTRERELWLGLEICRVLKRLGEDGG
ncbi:MAG TPA: prenyltransferase/squalene oxidase repeat-containing protein [Candidatus Desulfaltia sp.]|nr:prenyltransferase/squalene oxidase repeat-containing protein [Candidatus Desulfaltia sp.]